MLTFYSKTKKPKQKEEEEEAMSGLEALQKALRTFDQMSREQKEIKNVLEMFIPPEPQLTNETVFLD